MSMFFTTFWIATMFFEPEMLQEGHSWICRIISHFWSDSYSLHSWYLEQMDTYLIAQAEQWDWAERSTAKSQKIPPEWLLITHHILLQTPGGCEIWARHTDRKRGRERDWVEAVGLRINTNWEMKARLCGDWVRIKAKKRKIIDNFLFLVIFIMME